MVSSSPPLLCFSFSFLFVSTASLQQLDLISIRVLDEEELGLAAARRKTELPDRTGAERQAREAGVLRFEVVDRKRQLAIAIAQIVGLGTAMVDGQLQLGI